MSLSKFVSSCITDRGLPGEKSVTTARCAHGCMACNQRAFIQSFETLVPSAHVVRTIAGRDNQDEIRDFTSNLSTVYKEDIVKEILFRVSGASVPRLKAV